MLPFAAAVPARIGRFHHLATATGVLIVSVALTVLAWRVADHHVQKHAEERFEVTVEESSEAIVSRMQEYEQALRGGVGLFKASDQVTRADWRHYVETLQLDTYWPGIQGIGFTRMIAPTQLAEHIAGVRAEGYPEYTVRPAGVRAQYSAIVYLEPFNWRNQRAFGYDMYSEPVRRAAMELARDTGAPAISGRVTLVQETNKDVQPGFLMYLPVYGNGMPADTVAQRRAALVGFVYSPFRLHDLLYGILGAGESDVDFEIYDGPVPEPATLLHDSHRRASAGVPAFVATRQLKLPGRTWSVRFQSRPGFEADISSNEPTMILVGGLLFDLLLFATIWSLAGQKQRIEARAEAIAHELNRSESRYRSVVDHVNEIIFQTDAAGRWAFLNPAWEAITGWTVAETLGRPVVDFVYPEDRDLAWHLHRKFWNHAGADSRCELRFRHRNGGVRWLEVNGQLGLIDDAGQVEGISGTLTDVTSKRQHQQQLEFMAHHDALTQLPNRVLLADRLQVAVTQAQRSGKLVAVAYLDMDGFKAVNDTLGHDAGDVVLVEVARRLKSCVRGSDSVARLGGDEFVLLFSGLSSAAECYPMLERVLAVLAEPYHIGSDVAALTASIGVALYPQDDVDPDVLMRHADQAMYVAKQSGRNRYHCHDPERDRRVVERQTALTEIETALARGELVLYYQPKVNMREARMLGVEALIRWQHPERGLLAPDAFLPLLEGSPLAITLGEWVLQTALAQMAAWRAAGRLIPISVNISGEHLQSDAFLPYLGKLLAQYPDLPPDSLEIEVLETAALEDIDQAALAIAECHRLGVSVALDDFGTGYSSLTYFKRLPVDTLKIDQSFIRDMLVDDEDLAIVEGVVGLTRAFFRHVVAEGVETARHGLLLLRMGCEVGQGYGIAPPMPAGQVLDWADGFRGDPLWAGVERDLPVEDMPLLLVGSEHRDWLERLIAWLQQGAPDDADVPGLDPHACGFGRWCDRLGLKRYGDLPEFTELLRRHDQVHALAHRLVDAKHAGQNDAVARALPELMTARDQLLAQVDTLLARVRATAQGSAIAA